MTFSHERSPGYLFFRVDTISGSTTSIDFSDSNLTDEVLIPEVPLERNITRAAGKSSRHTMHQQLPENGFVLNLVVVYDDTMVEQYVYHSTVQTK